MDAQPERRIAGRYRLLEPIGQGGMGVVWKAHDELIDRMVAVKEVLHRDIREEEREKFNQRTIREARAAGRLSHPNVVVVHDVIEEDRRPWIVMQLVNARSLGQVIKTEGPLPPERVAAIGAQVLDALRTAHRAGVLHRDVKPENVLIGDDGRVVLTDFGIATMPQETSLTLTGGIVGTPAFLPPERLNGQPAVPESDLWSLGATLYAAVEGRSPFDRGAPVPTLAAILHEPPQPPHRAGPLTQVIEGLLRKDPAARMDAGQADELLRRVAAGDHPRAGGGPDHAQAGPAAGPPVGVGYGAGPTAPGQAPGGPSLDAPPYGPSTPTLPEGRTRPGQRSKAKLIALAVTLPALAVGGGITWYALNGNAATQTSSSATATAPGTEESTSPPSPVPDSSTGSSPTSDASPTGGSSPTASSSEDEIVVPRGWRLHKDPGGGFRVALPAEWTEFQRGKTSVKFHGPGSGGYLQIDWTVPEEPIRDPVRAWEDLERRVLSEGKFPGYRRLRIAPLRYLGRNAADWEFTWRPSTGTVHVLNRGFRTADGTPFAVYWQTSHGDWAKDRRFLRTFLNSFRPS